MESTYSISIQKTTRSNLHEARSEDLGFGNYVSDHMFDCAYTRGQWQTPAVVPFQDLTISPLTLALHYGQSVFEGLKAYRMDDGSINIFRLDKHHQRLNKSLERMSMPEVPYALFKEGLEHLVSTDQDWIPENQKGSLYIRPLIFASEAKFGVKISDEYRFIIFTGPVGKAFQNPLKVKVERKYIRAGRGGTGYAKCSGNYGGAFYPTQIARNEGFDQVIWTDATHHEFVEESGMMNLMFVIDGTLITPPLSDSILDGVTRDTLIEIAKSMKIPVEERPVSISEIIQAFRGKKITEAFGAGTAAIVAPIEMITVEDQSFKLPEYSADSIHQLLKEELEAIRKGKKEDVFGWNHIVTV